MADRIRKRFFGPPLFAVLGFWLTSGTACACISDLGVNSSAAVRPYLFPNWQQAEAAVFDTLWCSSFECPGLTDATIVGLTILNYGTASGGPGGDIAAMYACFDCSSAIGPCRPGSPSGVTLNYAGVWNVMGSDRHAWTWAGSPLALSADPCSDCACNYLLRVFVDIQPCPTDGATVRLGPGYNYDANELAPGGVSDSVACTAPYTAVMAPNDKTIVYAAKTADKDMAAPGDTIGYTIYYGRPGSLPLTNIVVFDSLPEYTRYLSGSASPFLDPGWDPKPGPPQRLLWTLPGGATTLGRTGAITFKATADWGNGESFEPGSGDLTAPEGFRLINRAQLSFVGSDCPVPNAVTLPTSTTIRRFLFWKVADNDLLFASQAGRPDEEIVYEVAIKNMSYVKTWWNVSVWDTVPAELDPWKEDCGLEDPFLGWTMTPTGAAAYSPGLIMSGGDTILTWMLDMPPGATAVIRWKAKIRPSVPADQTVVNIASVKSLGSTGIVGGTAGSRVPRTFAHLAPVVIPTTFISYVGFAAADNDIQGCPGFFIGFFPLNRTTQFELRGIQYIDTAWAQEGGVSDSIGCQIGSCVTGFPGAPTCTLGSGAIPGGGIPGCKAERSPAVYDPTNWHMNCPDYPMNFVYKVVANAPVLWQLLTHMSHDAQDNHTYSPATTLSYRGLMHYMWRRAGMDTGEGDGDALGLINTGLDSKGEYRPNLATTVHLFKWDFFGLSWRYVKTFELAPDSLAFELGPLIADQGPWRTLSSDAQLVVYQGNDSISTLFSSGCGDNFGTFMPTGETGNVVSEIGSGTFYGGVPGFIQDQKIVVGNVGPAGSTATYRIWRYLPDNPVAVGILPALLSGSSGTWNPVAVDWVPAGLGTAGNPRIYGRTFDAPSFAMYKIELLAGGPIQVLSGARVQSSWSGGAVMHAADGNQTGMEFWFNRISGDNLCKGVYGTQAINVFCPKANMVIRAETSDGLDTSYTTTGPDQCVSFMALSDAPWGVGINYRFTVLPGPYAGDVIAQYHQCKITEKGYTAPFLHTGTHYRLIAPPVAYAGQRFWITVVVIEANETKVDYCGVTGFSSTDPLAQIASPEPLGNYLYSWSNDSPGSACDTGSDNGVKLFVNVILDRIGQQSIIAADTMDGSITGIVSINVVGVDVKFSKEPKILIAGSGDIVQFRICWSNYSSGSALGFVITDAIPSGFDYIPGLPGDHICGATYGTGGITVAYSTTNNQPASFQTMSGSIAGVTWLRWTVPEISVNTTGCVCFNAAVK